MPGSSAAQPWAAPAGAPAARRCTARMRVSRSCRSLPQRRRALLPPASTLQMDMLSSARLDLLTCTLHAVPKDQCRMITRDTRQEQGMWPVLHGGGSPQSPIQVPRVTLCVYNCVQLLRHACMAVFHLGVTCQKHLGSIAAAQRPPASWAAGQTEQGILGRAHQRPCRELLADFERLGEAQRCCTPPAQLCLLAQAQSLDLLA